MIVLLLLIVLMMLLVVRVASESMGMATAHAPLGATVSSARPLLQPGGPEGSHIWGAGQRVHRPQTEYPQVGGPGS